MKIKSDSMSGARDCSVALSYTFGESAPLITATGHGGVAHKIREIADRCHIPLIKNPLLAEVLVEAEIGSCIPEETYQAVAAIFAFLKKKDGITGAQTN
jgi:hypothetical protein